METVIKTQIQIIKSGRGNMAIRMKVKNGREQSREQIDFDKAKLLIKKFSMQQIDKIEKDGKTIYTYA
jgi:Fe-S cluster assembly iron-binding protein IscA